jgi:hypothetical protein
VDLSSVDVDGAYRRIRRRVWEHRVAALGAVALPVGITAALWYLADKRDPPILAPEVISEIGKKGVAFGMSAVSALGGTVKVLQFLKQIGDLKQLRGEMYLLWKDERGLHSDSELWRNYKRFCFPPEKDEKKGGD